MKKVAAPFFSFGFTEITCTSSSLLPSGIISLKPLDNSPPKKASVTRHVSWSMSIYKFLVSISIPLSCSRNPAAIRHISLNSLLYFFMISMFDYLYGNCYLILIHMKWVFTGHGGKFNCVQQRVAQRAMRSVAKYCTWAVVCCSAAFLNDQPIFNH